MVNESGFNPRGRALLIKPYEPERRAGVIQLIDETKERDQMVEQRAVIIAIGSMAWRGEDEPRAKVGDRVLVARYSGYMAKGTKDGKNYRFVNDNDVFAVIEYEEDES